MACDNFLKFYGKAKAIGSELEVIGETQDANHKDALEIKEFSFGVENPTTIGSMSSGAGAGKAKLNEFTLKKAVDNASPTLFAACTMGCHFPEMQLTVRKAGGNPLDYLLFSFAMIFVTKIEYSGGAGEEAPDEDITFVYGAMKILYRRQGPDGKEVGKDTKEWSQVLNTNAYKVTGLTTTL